MKNLASLSLLVRFNDDFASGILFGPPCIIIIIYYYYYYYYYSVPRVMFVYCVGPR